MGVELLGLHHPLRHPLRSSTRDGGQFEMRVVDEAHDAALGRRNTGGDDAVADVARRDVLVRPGLDGGGHGLVDVVHSPIGEGATLRVGVRK